jgi:hypothetical protein
MEQSFRTLKKAARTCIRSDAPGTFPPAHGNATRKTVPKRLRPLRAAPWRAPRLIGRKPAQAVRLPNEECAYQTRSIAPKSVEGAASARNSEQCRLWVKLERISANTSSLPPSIHAGPRCPSPARCLSPAMRREGAFAQKRQDSVTKSSGLIASFGNALMIC